jgi:hypothetical protein
MIDMYRNLGIHWASSIPAFLALMCVPFPFLFYKYGEAIRLKCKFAAEAAAALERMRGGQAVEDEEGQEISEGEEENAEKQKSREAGRQDQELDKEIERGSSKEQ